MVQRGEIHTVTEVIQAAGGRLVRTAAVCLGLLKGPPIDVGDKLEIGNVCGDWCFIFIRGERVRANIIQTQPEPGSQGALG